VAHTDNIQYLQLNEPIQLELGYVFPKLTIAYHCYGQLNRSADNVIWVFHALTASSKIEDWWVGSFGENKILDTNKHFVVCANLIGSPYGSEGPLGENPQNGKPYFHDFPVVTIRDQVKVFQKLKDHLGINKIYMAVGGSMGACHALMAIEADPTWQENQENAGIEGMKAARAIGMVIYRNFLCYEKFQPDNEDTLTQFRAASYQRYQGQKLANRFNAFSYYRLLDSLDTHDVGRGRNSISEALSKIDAYTVIVNINTDLLYPLAEQQNLVKHIPNAHLEVVDSVYGHDGFLVETEKLTEIYTKHFVKA